MCYVQYWMGVPHNAIPVHMGLYVLPAVYIEVICTLTNEWPLQNRANLAEKKNDEQRTLLGHICAHSLSSVKGRL